MRARKILAQIPGGHGPMAARRLSALRPGPLGEEGVHNRIADQYVDVSPYLALGGLNIDREMDRRGDTMRDGDESHIQRRTRGQTRAAPKARWRKEIGVKSEKPSG